MYCVFCTPCHYILLYCGADVSILPYSLVKNPCIKLAYKLSAANDTDIKTYGLHEHVLDFGLPTHYRWTFIVAEVAVPIVGADFLQANHLLPDLTRRLLIDGKTLCSARGTLKPCNQPTISLLHADVDTRIQQLLAEFPNVAKPPQYQQQLKHDVVHHIETLGPPAFQKVRRLRPDLRQEVKDYFDEAVTMGLCRPSKSQWAAPLVPVQAKGKKLRIVGDYKRLNAQTKPDRYPIPNLHDSMAKLDGKKVFSCIDLVRAYHNIPIFPDDIEKTAVITPSSLFDFLRMSFGLRNASSMQQHFMHKILGYLPFLFIYIDDILCFSDSEEEHCEHLRIVFQILHKYSLAINLEKAKFFVCELDFLGQHISKDGFRPTEAKASSLSQCNAQNR